MEVPRIHFRAAAVVELVEEVQKLLVLHAREGLALPQEHHEPVELAEVDLAVVVVVHLRDDLGEDVGHGVDVELPEDIGQLSGVEVAALTAIRIAVAEYLQAGQALSGLVGHHDARKLIEIHGCEGCDPCVGLLHCRLARLRKARPLQRFPQLVGVQQPVVREAPEGRLDPRPVHRRHAEVQEGGRRGRGPALAVPGGRPADGRPRRSSARSRREAPLPVDQGAAAQGGPRAAAGGGHRQAPGRALARPGRRCARDLSVSRLRAQLLAHLGEEPHDRFLAFIGRAEARGTWQ
mmetsp:Transcript_8494/g.23885  ORF Transcript_8494/g.23885 Transcript_8494/m.23885 type:complete len:292 (+) Transcript_8494:1736-2611(+)